MSDQYLKLRRSVVPGKIPTTSSIDFGEIALNTYDGLAFMKKSGSLGEEIVTLGAGNTSGSYTGSFSGSFTGSVLLPSLTAGSVLFVGSDNSISQSNSTFFFNASTNRLGIGNASPSYPLDVTGVIRGSSDAYFNSIRVGKGPNSLTYNTVVGELALNSITIGDYNLAFGYQSQRDTTTGNNNVSFGFNSLALNTSGEGNTAFGTNTLRDNSGAGNYNTAIGLNASLSNISGVGNLSIGNEALLNNQAGSYNIAFGYRAGRYYSGFGDLTNAENSILIGADTTPAGDSETNQIVIGYGATGLGSNTTVLGNPSTLTTAIYGNLLLGTTTDAGYKFDVNGTTRLQGAVTAPSITGSLEGTSSWAVSASWSPNSVAGGTTNYIPLWSSSTSLTSSVIFQSGNNIGIGTTSSLAPLHVYGPSRFESFNTGVGNAAIKASNPYGFNLLSQISERANFYGYSINNPNAAIGIGGNALTNTAIQALNYSTNAATPLSLQYYGGNVLIGTYTADAGEKLQVVGTTRITPAANTPALISTGYSVTGSNSGSMIDLAGTWNTTGNPTAIKLNVTNTASTLGVLMDLQVGGTSIAKFRALGDLIMPGAGQFGGLKFQSAGINYIGTGISTTGTLDLYGVTSAFAPTSGSASWNVFSMRNTINQTGTASGIIRGVYIAPTLTAAADFRAIETTQGRVILADTYSASGSLSGSLLDMTQTWNTTGNPTAIKLNVTNTSSGASSNLMDLQVGGVSRFNIKSNGEINVGNSGTKFYVNGAATNYLAGTNYLDYIAPLSTDNIKLNTRVRIGSNIAPAASSIVDITSTTQGILLPRMTTTQRDAIASPAEGLIVYVTGSTGGLNYYNSGSTPGWRQIADTSFVSSSLSGSAGYIPVFTGTNSVSSSVIFQSGNNIGIGKTTPNSKLDVSGSVIITGSLDVSGSINVVAGTITTNNNKYYQSKNTGGSTLGILGIDASNNIAIGSVFVGAALINYTTTTHAWYTYPSSVATEKMRLTQGGNLLINSTTDAGYKLDVNGTTRFTGNSIVSGSLNVTSAITASQSLISGSGTQRLIVVGSGSAQPIFTVQGSQGELFSITDSLSGSLFSVNDISGLPILETFSDSTTLMGSYLAPALFTTQKTTTTNSGSFVIYNIPTGSYDGLYVDYTARSGSNARAGQIMAIWSGSSVNYTETTTTDFGTTSNLLLGVSISGSNMALTGSVATGSGWVIKSIIRSI